MFPKSARRALQLAAVLWVGTIGVLAEPRVQGRRASKPAAPEVELIEGERVNPDSVVIYVQSKLIEEGDAVAKMTEREENINNVRYNINSYSVGYSIDAEKVNDLFVFTGPIKAWRAASTSEVSRWPPLLYTGSRKETIRQVKLVEPIPIAESIPEANHLRLYYRPIPVGYENGKYREEPSSMAFFIHPETGNRMTVLFRGERSYGAVKEPIVIHSKIYVEEVVPGRGSESTTLVPSIFYSKDVELSVKPLEKGGPFDELMQTANAARNKPPYSTDNFRDLFDLMSSYTGGKTKPVTQGPAANGK